MGKEKASRAFSDVLILNFPSCQRRLASHLFFAAATKWDPSLRWGDVIQEVSCSLSLFRRSIP